MKFMKLGSKPDCFQTDGNGVRFVATELAPDIIVNVGHGKFHLHKFPLLSKSSRLQKLAAAASNESNYEIYINDIPGGPAAFEICAKFCYGMTVTLNAYNVVAARCAAEYLEMHETTEKGNLIYKIEVFLATSIFRSWKDSIVVLQSTKTHLPDSEELKLVSHCIESIASKASVEPFKVDWSYTYNRKKLPVENGLEPNWNGVKKQHSVPKDWWAEDLCELELELYKRVIVAVKGKGRVSGDVMGEALKAYIYRSLPGFRKGSPIERGEGVINQSTLETIIWLLPGEKGSVSCSFMLRLLRAACFLDCSKTSKRELVKRIGRQLEEASISDLLMPAPAGEIMVYDIDMVLSIVEEFVMQERNGSQNSLKLAEEIQRNRSPALDGTKMAVAKLVDGYLAEVAKDSNLPLSKFIDLAEMMSRESRPVHDGLYRAIDMYLKDHPGLSKSERKKLCGLMDCKRLSADACMHAVQNERLPLRVVVQVLFFEQARAAAATSGSSGTENGSASNGSSRSVGTTNTTEDNWDALPPTAEDLKSLKSMKLAGGARGSESSSSSDARANGKPRVPAVPKKMLGKLLSTKGHGSADNSSSDTSGSPEQDEPKSTPSRNMRRSVPKP